MHPVLEKVQQRLSSEHIALATAAREIGVTTSSLTRHLAGEYVRSDSLAKYREWLAEGTARNGTLPLPGLKQVDSPIRARAEMTVIRRASDSPAAMTELHPAPAQQPQPYLSIDLFSGCGGLSLGFDAFNGGQTFRTILALDIEDAMARCYNANYSGPHVTGVPICRRIDLADFGNETEIRAFYLEHLARSLPDPTLGTNTLENLQPLGLSDFITTITALDSGFLEQLQAIRASTEFRAALHQLSPSVLSQTSVIGFQHALGLPLLSSRILALPPLPWTSAAPTAQEAPLQAPAVQVDNEIFDQLEREWDSQVELLASKAGGSGRGQLASSARRIDEFLRLLSSSSLHDVKKVWLGWRSKRDSLRRLLFTDPATKTMLEAALTTERQVAVILGGPPCQGFSRIGRGKIRSLREGGFQVHYDSGAGDERNRLLEAYVLFLSALAPRVFLFENVRHFQAEVKTPDGTFLATDVLEEAIRDLSANHLRYRVSSRIVTASRHLIPQTRERFFMIGVREDALPYDERIRDVPKWVLDLEEQDELPLRLALSGLPAPHVAGDARDAEGPLARPVVCEPGLQPRSTAESRYLAWIHATDRDNPNDSPRFVDSHYVRAARPDDRALFELMGPGKRWMDYRSDDSQTVKRLRDLLEQILATTQVRRARKAANDGLVRINADELQWAIGVLDGSLSLRLLLESIPAMPGELCHHLITPEYLSKREGNHGDWLARLHADRPCKTIVSHMGKDTYAYVHPLEPRTMSVREAARVQTFPDWFSFSMLSFVDAFRVIGNAVPPLLSNQLAARVAQVLWACDESAQIQVEAQREHAVIGSHS